MRAVPTEQTSRLRQCLCKRRTWAAITFWIEEDLGRAGFGTPGVSQLERLESRGPYSWVGVCGPETWSGWELERYPWDFLGLGTSARVWEEEGRREEGTPGKSVLGEDTTANDGPLVHVALGHDDNIGVIAESAERAKDCMERIRGALGRTWLVVHETEVSTNTLNALGTRIDLKQQSASLTHERLARVRSALRIESHKKHV